MKDNSICIHSLPCCNTIVAHKSPFKIKSSNRTLHISATTAVPQYVDVKGHTTLLSSFISLQSFWWLCLFSLFRHRSLEWPSTWREIPASLPCGWAGPRRLTTKSSSRYWVGDKNEDFFGQCLFLHSFSWIFEQGVGNLLSFFGLPKIFCWFTSSALSLI